MSHADLTIDLVPAEFRAQEWLHRRSLSWTAVAAASLLTLILLTTALGIRSSTLENRVIPLRENVQTMQSWSAMLEPLASKLQLARSRQLVVTELLHEPNWSQLLSDLSLAATDDIWLREMNIAKETILIGTEEQEQYTLTITGIATANQEVIHFMTALLKSQHIGTLKLESSRTRQDETSPCVDFNLRGTVSW